MRVDLGEWIGFSFLDCSIVNMSELVFDLTFTGKDLWSYWRDQGLRTCTWYLYRESYGNKRGLAMVRPEGLFLTEYNVMSASGCRNKGWRCRCGFDNEGEADECGRCSASHPDRSQEVPLTSAHLYESQFAWPARHPPHRGVCLRVMTGKHILIMHPAQRREGGKVLFW